MQHDERFEQLDKASDWKLVDDDQDIRGRPLMSPEGEHYGKIDEMLVDKDKEEVVAIALEDGRMCGVEYLEIRDDKVYYRDPEPDYVPVYTSVTRPV